MSEQQNSKPALSSKTILVNGLLAIGAALAAIADLDFVSQHAEAIMGLVGIINIVLRVITSKPVEIAGKVVGGAGKVVGGAVDGVESAARAGGSILSKLKFWG